MIGTRIKALRKLNKITLKELASDLGISEAAVSRYESGNRTPNIDTLKNITALFNVPLGYLLDEGICAQRDLVKEFRDVITNELNIFGKRLYKPDMKDVLDKMDFEEFLIKTSRIMSRLEYDESSNTLHITWLIDNLKLSDENNKLKSFRNKQNSSENEKLDLSKFEEKIINKYRFLDDHGKRSVNLILDNEYKRCNANVYNNTVKEMNNK